MQVKIKIFKLPQLCNCKLMLKGDFDRNKVKLKWKSVKNAKKWAITGLNAPDGSRDIPFQSQEFEQDGCRHFVDFLFVFT